jgi:hypothetical protein
LTEPKPAPPPSNNPEPAADNPADRPEPLSLSYIERLAREMADRRPRRPASAAARPAVHPVGDTTLTVQTDRMRQLAPMAVPGALPQSGPARAAFRPTFDDHFRLTLTRWQSAGMAVAIAALVVGALGMAASGWVAAYHWSCRAGLATNYCAPATAPEPLALPEIPT